MVFYIAQIFGLIALILLVASYVQKEKTKFLFIHYFPILVMLFSIYY